MEIYDKIENKYNKLLVRKIILDFVTTEADKPSYYRSFMFHPIYGKEGLEGYYMELYDVKGLIRNRIKHRNGTHLTDDEMQKLFDLLKDINCFKIEDNVLKIVKMPLDYNLKRKFNITIDFVKDNIIDNIVDNILPISITAGGVVLVTFIVVGFVNHQKNLDKYYENQAKYRQMEQKYYNSILVDDDKTYYMGNIYVVYDVDNVYFCTKKIQKVTEKSKTKGKFNVDGSYIDIHGEGEADEYYYRDEIYDYYDIKTGKKICSDHEDGFYIEKLLDFYTVDKMNVKNYKISLDEIENDIDNDYLLSRDPGLKRK